MCIRDRALSAVVSEELNPIAERLKKIGYDGVECFVGAADDPAAYLAFGKHAADLGLEMTAVTVMSPETNPISESAEVREKALDLSLIHIFKANPQAYYYPEGRLPRSNAFTNLDLYYALPADESALSPNF